MGGEITGIALLPMFVFRLQRNALISPLHHCGLWFYVGHARKKMGWDFHEQLNEILLQEN